jgi:phenylpropionate dioxygenase-like ring-hydroxylating dioxygenase large terminal subunit
VKTLRTAGTPTRGRTEGFLDYFFAPGADPEWVTELLAPDDQVGAEDVVLVESVQGGIAPGALDGGALLLPSESLIAAFQRWGSDALAREPQLPGA